MLNDLNRPKLTVSYARVNLIIDPCERTIGPRRYYLPTAVGGEAWSVVRSADSLDFVVATEDEYATMIIALRYGLSLVE
jgi:hypothetical protein